METEKPQNIVVKRVIHRTDKKDDATAPLGGGRQSDRTAATVTGRCRPAATHIREGRPCRTHGPKKTLKKLIPFKVFAVAARARRTREIPANRAKRTPGRHERGDQGEDGRNEGIEQARKAPMAFRKSDRLPKTAVHEKVENQIQKRAGRPARKRQEPHELVTSSTSRQSPARPKATPPPGRDPPRPKDPMKLGKRA